VRVRAQSVALLFPKFDLEESEATQHSDQFVVHTRNSVGDEALDVGFSVRQLSRELGP
jgi:hypothetical protein